jgi:hypothetical protein
MKIATNITRATREEIINKTILFQLNITNQYEGFFDYLGKISTLPNAK